MIVHQLYRGGEEQTMMRWIFRTKESVQHDFYLRITDVSMFYNA